MTRLLRAAWLPPPAPGPATVFPNAGNTGANLSGLPLVSVPSQATSGPGWVWQSANNYIYCGTPGATISGLSLPAGGAYLKAANITLENSFLGGSEGIYVNGVATNATIGNCVVQTPGGSNPGAIRFAQGSNYGTVANCTLSGSDSSTNRVQSGVYMANSDPLFTMYGNDVFWCKNMWENAQNSAAICYVNMYGNYLHDLGYVALDHSDGIYMAYGLGGSITGNTIFVQLTQTDCVGPTAMNPVPLTISGNLFAGAGYTIYGGTPTDHVTYSGPTQFLTFTNNYFSTMFYPNCGAIGPYVHWGPLNNTWANNYWYDGPLAGQPIVPVAGFTYQTPPAVPASGTPLVNPFGTYVTVVVTAPAGCTQTAVTPTPNTVLIPPAGATPQIMVPGDTMIAGASITLTYTGTTPTWTWTT